MFRLAFGIDLLLDLLQHFRRNVVRHVLGVHRQHPGRALSQAQKVDHAKTTAFARPATPHRSLRTPPEPGITSPASGCTISDCCNAAYSSSVRYCCTNFVNSFVSTNVTSPDNRGPGDGDRHCHHRSRRVEEVQLFAIGPPPWKDAASRG